MSDNDVLEAAKREGFKVEMLVDDDGGTLFAVDPTPHDSINLRTARELRAWLFGVRHGRKYPKETKGRTMKI